MRCPHSAAKDRRVRLAHRLAALTHSKRVLRLGLRRWFNNTCQVVYACSLVCVNNYVPPPRLDGTSGPRDCGYSRSASSAGHNMCLWRGGRDISVLCPSREGREWGKIGSECFCGAWCLYVLLAHVDSFMYMLLLLVFT